MSTSCVSLWTCLAMRACRLLSRFSQPLKLLASMVRRSGGRKPGWKGTSSGPTSLDSCSIPWLQADWSPHILFPGCSGCCEAIGTVTLGRKVRYDTFELAFRACSELCTVQRETSLGQAFRRGSGSMGLTFANSMTRQSLAYSSCCFTYDCRHNYQSNWSKRNSRGCDGSMQQKLCWSGMQVNLCFIKHPASAALHDTAFQ